MERIVRRGVAGFKWIHQHSRQAPGSGGAMAEAGAEATVESAEDMEAEASGASSEAGDEAGDEARAPCSP